MKRVLSLILSLLLFPGFAAHALDADPASGKCGGNLTWSYSNGTLTIQGTGNMEDYSLTPGNTNFRWESDTPWFSYADAITSVVIGNGVTGIGAYAFSNCHNLTNVTIPDSVTSIGPGTFFACTALTGVAIPEGVTTIEADTFRYCSSLKNVSIPESVNAIRESAFYGCSSLSSVTIPDGVTIIDGAVFYDCTSLTSVTIPASVTTIRMYAFYCEGLKDIYYRGSEDQWQQIDINARYNVPLFDATIHYNSGAPASSTLEGGISVNVGGKAVEWTDAEPFIDANDRTMVPLRAVADAMSLDVSWDGSVREAAFTNGSKTIFFPAGSTSARTSDGGNVQMDTAAVIVNERTYAPIRYLAEFFGYQVVWDPASQTVTIK